MSGCLVTFFLKDLFILERDREQREKDRAKYESICFLKIQINNCLMTMCSPRRKKQHFVLFCIVLFLLI